VAVYICRACSRLVIESKGTEYWSSDFLSQCSLIRAFRENIAPCIASL